MRHQRHPIATRLVQVGPSCLPLRCMTHESGFLSHVSHVVLHVRDDSFPFCDVRLHFAASFASKFAAKDPMEARRVFQGNRKVNRHHIRIKDMEKVGGSDH